MISIFKDCSGEEPSVFLLMNHLQMLNFHRHSKKQLPRYAVPIFLRVVKEMTPSHNNKQLKVHLRAEGVDPEKVSGAEEILYLVPGSERYEAFSMDDWRRLQNGKARL